PERVPQPRDLRRADVGTVGEHGNPRPAYGGEGLGRECVSGSVVVDVRGGRPSTRIRVLRILGVGEQRVAGQSALALDDVGDTSGSARDVAVLVVALGTLPDRLELGAVVDAVYLVV